MPYFPLGFTDFSQTQVAAGFKTEDKLYLAVWNLGGGSELEIPLSGINAQKAQIGYPRGSAVKFDIKPDRLTVKFNQKYQAAFFEIFI